MKFCTKFFVIFLLFGKKQSNRSDVERESGGCEDPRIVGTRTPCEAAHACFLAMVAMQHGQHRFNPSPSSQWLQLSQRVSQRDAVVSGLYVHWVHQSHNWQGCAGCSTVSSVCPSCASIFHLLGLSTHVPTIYAPVPRPISQPLTSCTHQHSSTHVHRVLQYDLHLCRVVHEVRASLHTSVHAYEHTRPCTVMPS